MTLRYEINPPKITPDSNLSQDETIKLLDSVKQRVSEISSLCDGVHFTDSVLGIPRVSPVTTGTLIRKSNQKIEITASLRVRDKNLTTLRELMEDAVSGGLNGVLILKGDASPNEQKDSGLISSSTVKYFKELGFGKKLDIFLSLPSNPNFDKIQKKIEVGPTGFVTQVIQSPEQVFRIVDKLKPQGFKIIPVIMVPSEKNAKSFAMLGIDHTKYQDRFIDFISDIHKSTKDVLITSPNDFKAASDTLAKLKELKRK